MNPQLRVFRLSALTTELCAKSGIEPTYIDKSREITLEDPDCAMFHKIERKVGGSVYLPDQQGLDF